MKEYQFLMKNQLIKILLQKNKIIYFIGNDHAGFGSSRFQTVPYILGYPVTIKLERSTENVLTLTQPTHNCYNYLTLNYK